LDELTSIPIFSQPETHEQTTIIVLTTANSFNKYLQVAAQTTRNSLKPELQKAAVLSRGKTEAKVIKYTNGVAADAVPLKA
jgi:F-type H+-transporting ATPase subunit epsilon